MLAQDQFLRLFSFFIDIIINVLTINICIILYLTQFIGVIYTQNIKYLIIVTKQNVYVLIKLLCYKTIMIMITIRIIVIFDKIMVRRQRNVKGYSPLTSKP